MSRALMNPKQVGLSMASFLMWCVILAAGALIGFKLVPAYTEDLTIKKHFRTIADDSTFASGNRGEIEAAFSKRAQIDRIEVISAKDIVVTKDGGGISLSARYTTRIPLFFNVNACLDFNPSSK